MVEAGAERRDAHRRAIAQAAALEEFGGQDAPVGRPDQQFGQQDVHPVAVAAGLVRLEGERETEREAVLLDPAVLVEDA